MQQEFATYGIDLALAAQGRLWQEPVALQSDSTNVNAPVVQVGVRRYGRFGNNVYQFLNAATIARYLRIPVVNLQGLAMHQASVFNGRLGIEVVENAPTPLRGSSLNGNFYAPYGFENLFVVQQDAALCDLVAQSAVTIYNDLVGKSLPSRSLALHFRGGDIFSSDDVHRWYVQPPASYYLRAVDHALANDLYDAVEVVCEDRSNPAIATVEAGLIQRKLAFNAEAATLRGDIIRLLSARAIISSFGTFGEAAALLSRNLTRYYGFRGLNSQTDLHPFVQMKFGSVLKLRDVRCFVVDDIAHEYTTPKTWRNTVEQRDAIASYPSHHLRIYEA